MFINTIISRDDVVEKIPHQKMKMTLEIHKRLEPFHLPPNNFKFRNLSFIFLKLKIKLHFFRITHKVESTNMDNEKHVESFDMSVSLE